jgi:hypothetical protein
MINRTLAVAALSLTVASCGPGASDPHLSPDQLYDQAVLGWCVERVVGSPLQAYVIEPETNGREGLVLRVQSDWRPVHSVGFFTDEDRTFCLAVGSGDRLDTTFGQSFRNRLRSPPISATLLEEEPRGDNSVTYTYLVPERDIVIEVSETRNTGEGVRLSTLVKRADAPGAVENGR